MPQESRVYTHVPDLHYIKLLFSEGRRKRKCGGRKVGFLLPFEVLLAGLVIKLAWEFNRRNDQTYYVCRCWGFSRPQDTRNSRGLYAVPDQGEGSRSLESKGGQVVQSMRKSERGKQILTQPARNDGTQRGIYEADFAWFLLVCRI